jgi:hypothetical protein
MTPTREALALMGQYCLSQTDLPPYVPWSAGELARAAHEEFILYHVPSISIKQVASSGAKIAYGRIPAQYRCYRVFEIVRGSEWVLGKIATSTEGEALCARNAFFLSVFGYRHPLVRQHREHEVKTGTPFRTDGSVLGVSFNRTSVIVTAISPKRIPHRHYCFVGEARRSHV